MAKKNKTKVKTEVEKAKKAKKVEVPKVEEIKDPKKMIEHKLVVSAKEEGNYMIVIDEEQTTYKILRAEYEAL